MVYRICATTKENHLRRWGCFELKHSMFHLELYWKGGDCQCVVGLCVVAYTLKPQSLGICHVLATQDTKEGYELFMCYPVN